MGKSKGRWRQKLAQDQGRELKFPDMVEQNDSKLVEKLIKQAEKHVESFDYDRARECYESALKDEPDNVKALEAYAAVLLELSEVESAATALNHAATLSPTEGHSKFFSLAQLNEGKKALEHYRRGVDIVSNWLENGENQACSANESPESVRLDMSNAYCAMAEIYMTDCCDEADAEEQCTQLIAKAIEACATNPEAYQCLANYQLVKGETTDAKETMSKSLSLWLPKHQKMREKCEEIEDCPMSYDSRISTSKMLIELEMFEEASDILEGLLDENDEVADVWYLLGWSNYLHGGDYRGNARFYLRKTKQVSEKLGDDEDSEQTQHVRELLEELGDDESEAEGSDDEPSDEWETEDEMDI